MTTYVPFTKRTKHSSLSLLMLNCYFICSLFGLTLSAKAAGSEAPSVVEFSSCTVHSSYELVGATYMMHMGGGSFMSHKASYNSTWAPGATNNLAVNLTYTFQMADPVLFNMMSPEDQDMYMQNTNNFSEGVSTNSTASSPLTTPEYRSTYYALNAQHADISSSLRLQTKGYTNSSASSVFKITVSAYNLLRDSDGLLVDTVQIDPGEIEILGLTPNASGIVYKVLTDNTAVDVTPVINQTTYSNYIFYVEAERVKVTVNFKNTGELTQQTTNGVGYSKHNFMTLFTGTNQLGMLNWPDAPIGGLLGFCELSVTDIPEDSFFDSGWVWHRDVQTRIYYYNTSSNIPLMNIQAATNDFSGNPYSPGDGNDPTDMTADATPDSNRDIFNSDAPGFSIPNDSDKYPIPYPNGVIWAFRFSAREWVTSNGAVASNIRTWHFFFTIKKTSSGWEAVGGPSMNSFGTGEDISEFTEDDADGL